MASSSAKPPVSMRRARLARRAQLVLGTGAVAFLLYRLLSPLF